MKLKRPDLGHFHQDTCAH